MSEKKFDVFISHSSKDALAASAIKQHLQGVGIRCWKAPDDIMPGESWPQAILRALANCHAMVLVWSSNSTASGEVSKELTLAMRNNITVVPFRIEDVKASGEWEYHLANTHWMDAFIGDIDNYFAGLASYLNRVLPEREPSLDKVKKTGTKKPKANSVFETSSWDLFDKLIDSALQDGVISDVEMVVLTSRAATLGIDKGELDLILKAKLEERAKVSSIDKQSVDRNVAPDPINSVSQATASPPILPPAAREKTSNSSTSITVNKKLWVAYVLVIIFGLFGYFYTSWQRTLALFFLYIVAASFAAGNKSAVGLLVFAFFYFIPLLAIKVWGFRQGLIPRK